MFARLSIWETRDGAVGIRRPLSGLPPLDVVPGTVAFLTVMIGTVTFDGLSQGELWRTPVGRLRRRSCDGLGIGPDRRHEDRLDDRAGAAAWR